jgi:hypothetical protein
VGELNYHDACIHLINFLIEESKLIIIINEYSEVMPKIVFVNVFDWLYTRRQLDDSFYRKSLIDWFAIPNEEIQDNYLDEVRTTYIANGSQWNEDLFGVKIMVSVMSNIKVICESVRIERLNFQEIDLEI